MSDSSPLSSPLHPVLEAIRSRLDRLTHDELYLLKQELDRRMNDTADWLDSERSLSSAEEDPPISLEAVRRALASIESAMSESVITGREDRF